MCFGTTIAGMKHLVTVFGVLIVFVGIAGLLSPVRFRAVFQAWPSQPRFIAAIVLRLLFGALLIIVAESLMFPHAVKIIGVISLLAAVGILIMGRERLDNLVDWWLGRSDVLVRVSALFAAAFGAFFVYVSI